MISDNEFSTTDDTPTVPHRHPTGVPASPSGCEVTFLRWVDLPDDDAVVITHTTDGSVIFEIDAALWHHEAVAAVREAKRMLRDGRRTGYIA